MLMDRGRSIRKMLGQVCGRQACWRRRGLIALEVMPARLQEDHAHARWIAEQVAGMGGCRIDLETVQTNIVIFRPEGKTAAGVIAGLKSSGILCGTAGPEEVRFVTHRDVDRPACERAVKTLRGVIRAA